jgi:abortive infection bacteriophage resistance protein
MRTSVGFFMSRSDRIYDKPPLLIEEMIALLESRNLRIPDRDKACHYLRYINYYRLSGYGYLFEEDHSNGRSHRFRDEVSFDDLLALYVFDRHLRLLLMDAIERIEVGVRTVMAYELSHKYGGGHWMLNSAIFEETPDFSHAELIRIIKRETASSAEEGSDRHVRREPFLNHYFSNYDKPELPPAWILSEVLSLGVWSRVFANLRQSKDRKQISRIFDLAPDTLKSWLHSLTYLRNLCAHHSRIYGRGLAFPPALLDIWPRMPESFCRYIAVLEYLLKKVAPDTNWGIRVKQLIEAEPRIDQNLLGIHDEQFWNAVLNPNV